MHGALKALFDSHRKGSSQSLPARLKKRHPYWYCKATELRKNGQLTSLNAMSSKYELICGDRSAAVDKLFEGEGDVCTLPSSVGRGVRGRSPRDEPAIATASSSFKDSKLCAASTCGMLSKS